MEREKEPRLTDREQNIQFLFGGIDPAPQETIEEMPLADLLLATDRLRPSSYTNAQSAKHAKRVPMILDAAYALTADSPAESAYIFGDLDLHAQPNEAKRLARITSLMISKWDQVCHRHGRVEPFVDLPANPLSPDDLERPDVQLVLEAAAAVTRAFAVGYPRDASVTSQRTYELARFLARRGPAYAEAWINGDIIRAHCESIGANPALWLKAIPVGKRPMLAVCHKEPLIAAAQLVEVYQPRFSTSIASISLELPRPEPRIGFRQPLEQRPHMIPDAPTHERLQQYEVWLDARSSLQIACDSLTKLTRATPLARSPLIEEQQHAARCLHLPKQIKDILMFHDYLAQGGGDGLALFGTQDTEALAKVVGLSAKIIWLWERASVKTDSEHTPFANLPNRGVQLDDFSRTDVQLVIEAAAGVLTLLQAGYAAGSEIRSTRHHGIAAFMARTSVPDALRWIRGDTIREHCRETGLDADTWLTLMPPYLRAAIITSSRDPLRKFDAMVWNYTTILTPENIAEATGWTTGKVNWLFSPAHRMRLCSYNQPLDTAIVIARRFEEDLSLPRIQNIIELPITDVRKLFSASMRFQLAAWHRTPLRAVRRMWTQCKVLMKDYGLNRKLALYAAHQYGDRCIDRAMQIVAERDLRPRYISQSMWEALVMRFPNPEDPRRAAHLAKYNLWKKILSASSLDQPVGSDSDLNQYERIANPASDAQDPFEIVSANEPGEILTELAERAGVAPEEVRLLMRYLATGEELQERGDLRATFERLRRAALNQPVKPEDDEEI